MVNFVFNTNTFTVSIKPQIEDESYANSTFLLCNPNSLTNDVSYTINANNDNTTECTYNSNSDAFNMIILSDTLPNSLFQTCQWQFSQNPNDITTYALSTGANPPQNVTMNPPTLPEEPGIVTFTSNPYPLSFFSPNLNITTQNPYYMYSNIDATFMSFLGMSNITSTTNLCNIQPVTQISTIIGNNNPNFEISINSPYNSLSGISYYPSDYQDILVISADGDNVYLNGYMNYTTDFNFKQKSSNNNYFLQVYNTTSTTIVLYPFNNISSFYVYTTGTFTTTFYVGFYSYYGDNCQIYLNNDQNQFMTSSQSVQIEYNANTSSFSIYTVTPYTISG